MSTWVQYSANAGSLAGAYIILAVGFHFVLRTTRTFHVDYGATYLLGAYGAYFARGWVLGSATVKCVGSLIFAALVAATWSLLADTVVHRPLRDRNAAGVLQFVAAFGVLTVIQNTILVLCGPTPRPGFEKLDLTYSILDAPKFSAADLIIVISGIVAAASGWFWLHRSRSGALLRAVCGDPTATRLIGIDSRRVIRIGVVAGGMFGGIAAGVVTLNQALSPSTGLPIAIKALVANTLLGPAFTSAVLGAVLLAVLETATVILWGSSSKDGSSYVLLLVILLIRCRGLEYRGKRRAHI